MPGPGLLFLVAIPILFEDPKPKLGDDFFIDVISGNKLGPGKFLVYKFAIEALYPVPNFIDYT